MGEDDKYRYQLENLNPQGKEKTRKQYLKEQQKCMFGRKPKNIYVMNNIHYNDVKNISEFSLLHDLLNPSKHINNYLSLFHYTT